MRPLEWQRICDVYDYTVNVKGTSVYCAATEVHICSNYLVKDWWGEKTRYNEMAVYRRIHEVHWHYEFKKYRIYKSETPGAFDNCAMVKFMAAYNEQNPIFVHEHVV